jgi:hypothetical protein
MAPQVTRRREVPLYAGFDPGGAEAFGWAVVSGTKLPLVLVAHGIANHAQQAVRAAIEAVGQNALTAIGIDAPLFWRPDGDRKSDQLVRNAIIQLGARGGTVNSVNSMRGTCLVQGMMVAMLLRVQESQLPIIEAHPKALLWLLRCAHVDNHPAGIALSSLQQWIVGNNLAGASDHERDAALGALSAFAMAQGMNGWQNLYPREPNPISPLHPPPGYWLPGALLNSSS